jgi:hypothetical protein
MSIATETYHIFQILPLLHMFFFQCSFSLVRLICHAKVNALNFFLGLKFLHLICSDVSTTLLENRDFLPCKPFLQHFKAFTVNCWWWANKIVQSEILLPSQVYTYPLVDQYSPCDSSTMLNKALQIRPSRIADVWVHCFYDPVIHRKHFEELQLRLSTLCIWFVATWIAILHWFLPSLDEWRHLRVSVCSGRIEDKS